MAEALELSRWSEGDARTRTHAEACCHGYLSDRCWCHGITTKPDGSERADAEVTRRWLAAGRPR